MHQERDDGQLKPGMLADLTVLNRNSLTVPHDELATLTVGATIVNGEVAYRS